MCHLAYDGSMQIETDDKYRRPGTVLMATGVVLLIARFLVGWLPLIGGALAFFCLVAGIFGLVGGAFLLVTKGRN